VAAGGRRTGRSVRYALVIQFKKKATTLLGVLKTFWQGARGRLTIFPKTEKPFEKSIVSEPPDPFFGKLSSVGRHPYHIPGAHHHISLISSSPLATACFTSGGGGMSHHSSAIYIYTASAMSLNAMSVHCYPCYSLPNE
jgi:hypothetical protein